MEFLDDMIVTLAHRIQRGVMAVGTGLVYIQFFALAFVLAMAGTVTLAVIVVAAKSALLFFQHH